MDLDSQKMKMNKVVSDCLKIIMIIFQIRTKILINFSNNESLFKIEQNHTNDGSQFSDGGYFNQNPNIKKKDPINGPTTYQSINLKDSEKMIPKLNYVSDTNTFPKFSNLNLDKNSVVFPSRGQVEGGNNFTPYSSHNNNSKPPSLKYKISYK